MTISFTDLGVPADLAAVLARKGIESPFPIQSATVPDALAGRDVMGKAPTGSGKTIAFGLAVAAKATTAKPKRPTALILAPTRELADQIAREVEPLAAARGQRVAAVYGGVGYGAQQNALRRGVEILIACPGRLEDLILRNEVSLAEVRIAVLDEADRMADMGFLPAVRRLLDQVHPDRQTLLFSATLDGEVEKVAKAYQREPVRHEAEAEARSVGEVRTFLWKVKPDARVDLLVDIVLRTGTVIVFCRTRHGVDRLAKKLNAAGVGAANLHGGRAQNQRDRALAAFTSGRVPVLVATDVAARGIHVDQVACVVHFDPPADSADFVHRSGRTGRAGEPGTVVCMIGKQDEHPVRKMLGQIGIEPAFEHPDLDVLGDVLPVRVDAKRPSQEQPAAAADRPERRQRDEQRERRDDNRPKQQPKPKARPEAKAEPAGEPAAEDTAHRRRPPRRRVNSAGHAKPGPSKIGAAKLRHKRRKRKTGAQA